MKIIYTHRGDEILVDDDNYDDLNRFSWRLIGKGYAARLDLKEERNGPASKGRKTIYMHRQILGLPPSRQPQVDHCNLNRCDNRKTNLRLSNNSFNQANTLIRKHNKLGVKGVIRHKKGYVANITVNGRLIYIGKYNTIEEAGAAYRARAKIEFGEHACEI